MNFFKSLSWAVFGRFSYILSQGAIVIYLSKNFSLIEVGYFGVATALTSPIFQFTNINLRSLVVTDEKNRFTFDEYLNVRIVNSLISLVIITLLPIVLSYSPELIAIIVVSAIYKFIENYGEIYYAFLQKYDCQKEISKSLIIKTILILLMMSLSAYFNLPFLNFLITIYFPIIIVVIYWDRRQCYKYVNYKYNIKSLKNFFPTFFEINKQGFSLGLTATLTSLNSSIPKLLIAQYLSTAQLGIFVPIGYVYSASGNFVWSMKTVILPRITKSFHKNLSLFNKKIVHLVIFSLFIGFLQSFFIYLFGDILLEILFNSEYSKHIDVFIILMLAGGFSYAKAFIFSALIVMRKHNIQPIIIFLGLLFNALSGIILIPLFGLIGAGVSILVTNIIVFLISLFFFKKYLKPVQNN